MNTIQIMIFSHLDFVILQKTNLAMLKHYSSIKRDECIGGVVIYIESLCCKSDIVKYYDYN